MTTKNYCPKCNEQWEEEETIYEYFIKKGYSKERASESAEMYGCTNDKPLHFWKNVVGIESTKYDGITRWKCQKCNTVFDRFTMKEIIDYD